MNPEAVEDDLGRECDAFLEGRYVEWLQHEGLRVPAWARLNRPAHAGVAMLDEPLGVPFPRCPRTWEDAEVLISAAVTAATSAETLPVVQHEVLVPLEFELMTRVMSPRAALERVCQSLY